MSDRVELMDKCGRKFSDFREKVNYPDFKNQLSKKNQARLIELEA